MQLLPLFSGDLQETGFVPQENRNTITAKHLKLKGRDNNQGSGVVFWFLLVFRSSPFYFAVGYEETGYGATGEKWWKKNRACSGVASLCRDEKIYTQGKRGHTPP